MLFLLKSQTYYSILCLLCLPVCLLKAQNYGGNYDWRMLGGGPLQIVSFHIGTVTSVTHGGQTGYSIGGSIGWNYLSSFYGALRGVDHIFDMGVRVKYNFNDIGQKSHIVGAELYLHFPCSTTNLFRHMPQPLSLIFGGGGIFMYPNTESLSSSVNGRYIEVGIGIMKYFVVNVNVLYRWSFFPNNSIGVLPLEQSFHIEFAIF